MTVAGTDTARTVLRQLAQLRTALSRGDAGTRGRGDALNAAQTLTHAMICATFR